jgi:hypothetical protein
MPTQKNNSIAKVPILVRRLYEIVGEFEDLFKGRKFTLDGHLVGSIGEVIAAHRYGLTLLPASYETHDATTPNGVPVQIKTTQAKSVALRAKPKHLIVLFLASNGEVTEVFNGPGSIAWAACGKRQKNGQRPIGLSKLRALMANMLDADAYQPVPHDAAFHVSVLKQPGVQTDYDALEEDYTASHALLAARRDVDLTAPVKI